MYDIYVFVAVPMLEIIHIHVLIKGTESQRDTYFLRVTKGSYAKMRLYVWAGDVKAKEMLSCKIFSTSIRRNDKK